jgi:hypothetical protein
MGIGHMSDFVTTQPSADGRWEQLEECLGLPTDADARLRVAELQAEGWQFLGVYFKSGVWWFRRPIPQFDTHSIR